MLGVICLVTGLGCVWRLLDSRLHREGVQRRWTIAQLVLLVQVLWLFMTAHSMTSLACFALGGIVLVAAGVPSFRKSKGVLHALILVLLLVPFSALFLNVGASELVEGMGKDATLTGRTGLWKLLLEMNQSPWLGAGYESFWLGERLQKIWAIHWWRPNESHNGYLEVFMNLGWAGISLLTLVIVMGYRNCIRSLNYDRSGPLRLAFFVVAIAYSFTEAGFRLLSPIWILFVMSGLALPNTATAQPAPASVPSAARKPSTSPWRQRKPERPPARRVPQPSTMLTRPREAKSPSTGRGTLKGVPATSWRMK
jgi:O-antigen ligase